MIEKLTLINDLVIEETNLLQFYFLGKIYRVR